MAWHLFRLGRWSFVHRRTVAGIWLLLLVLAGAGTATLAGQTDDNFTLPGLESTDAFALIEERSPSASPDGATANIVFEAAEGKTLADSQDEITAALAQVKTDDVASVSDPFTSGTISESGRVGYATVSYAVTAADLSDADKDALESVKSAAEDAGVTTAVGGDALDDVPAAGSAEAIGIVVALVVLAITFGSLVAAGMPLITAIIGVGIGYAGISTLTGFVDLSSVTPALGSMLGLAVGIDYALFIMSRYQHEVRSGRSLEEAAGAAVGTAGSAVIFAGLTVIIALAGLSITGITFLTQMGVAAAAMVAIAVLIALTLLPAILGFAGPRITRGGIRGLKQRDPEDDADRTNGRRWVETVSRLRWPALVAGVALAAVISIPVTKMELAIPDDATAASGSDARIAYDLISENFGAGANGPLVVVVDTIDATDKSAAVAAVQTRLAAIPQDDIAALVPPVTSDTEEAQTAFQQQLEAVNLANFTIIPKSGPSDADTKDLVNTIRDALADLPAETGAKAMVTGQTAVGVDISQKLMDVFPLYLLVVVGLAFLLLVLVFRSILVPLKAALGFLLSVGIALGSTVAVFQWGWLNNLLGLDITMPVLFILPLLLTGVLFGLAMDYEVFLVTRMREAYVHGTEARKAVIEGFSHSARVVTAAAVIMFGVFAGFALGHDVMIKTIGFALAVGVIADAFLVRMLIVPAVMAIIGKSIWWLPAWLDRALPNLDIEGEALLEKIGPAPGHQEPVTTGS
ncbi:MMPL family transporter [Kineosporia sp. J2-2]|uniref:MMPL family transporter n=1 Tax=Kineosporia corallincola TaxID=2835133 RepID=A0ABS5TKZ5_9ACTN|nr:MMPL family transporter [Kineosporia corallincola]MBT0770743.1 MMPL family transporter [Kineosporia corallincola]